MPKTRRRVAMPGAKSIAVTLKNKIGGRKSFTTVYRMSVQDLKDSLSKCRKRDRNKLRRALESRGIVLPS